MKSEFNFAAYWMFLLGILFPLLLGVVALDDRTYSNLSSTELIIACAFFLCIYIWMIFGELRTKVISITMADNNIVIRRYLGLGFVQRINANDITGFKISVLPSRAGSYEYLYLMVGDRRVAKLSVFYHSNYKELKKYVVSLNIKFIGKSRFSNRQELRDIFIK